MSPPKKKSRRRKKTPVKAPDKSWIHLLFWGAATGITLVALVGILILPRKEPPQVPEVSSAPVSGEAAKPVSRLVSIEPKSEEFLYRERTDSKFQLRTWEVDMAILNVLERMEMGKDNIVHTRLENRFFYGTSYHFQDMKIFTNARQQEFIRSLRQVLYRFVDNALLKKEIGDHKWSVSINGHITHILRLDIDPWVREPGTGKLVIIIDDLGESLEFANRLSELDFPVTFSILPYLQETKKVADFAWKNGYEVMLHMPMEPLDYHRGVNPGPGAMYVDMRAEEIEHLLAHSLKQIPMAVGVNNHMGSRFTQDYDKMKVVFEELRKRDLFFLDSVTTPKSVAPALAEEMGLDFMQRNVFLDNVRHKEAIIYQLKKAENLALRYGHAVAIGHPYPETLQALKTWSENRSPKVHFARIDDLLLDQKIRILSEGKDRETALAN